MTMTELKGFIMDNVVESKQDIIVPEIDEIELKFMSRKEMKVRKVFKNFREIFNVNYLGIDKRYSKDE